MKKTKIDLQNPNGDLRNLRETLRQIDITSQSFLEMKSLTATRRVELNEAARTLKRIIIMAQTDLWNILTAEDREAAMKENSKNDDDYQIYLQWKPKKSAKKRVKKK